jgi:hypothetical protein
VQVHARSSFGNIVIRHATAAQHIQVRHHNGTSGGLQLAAAV